MLFADDDGFALDGFAALFGALDSLDGGVAANEDRQYSGNTAGNHDQQKGVVKGKRGGVRAMQQTILLGGMLDILLHILLAGVLDTALYGRVVRAQLRHAGGLSLLE